MATCSVRWRPSGGRGEFEFVPATSLADREISVDFGELGVVVDSEVHGAVVQGKPRLRKREKNNRAKFHLPQLVMAVLALPEPAREDLSHEVVFPLENKRYVMNAMDFDIVDDDGLRVVLLPLRVTVLHSEFEINLTDRIKALSVDFANLTKMSTVSAELERALADHKQLVDQAKNDAGLRKTADKVIALKTDIFGLSNAGSATKLLEIESLPPSELEEITGKEGRLLVRLHVYKERDRGFAKRVRDHYRRAQGGKLCCQACGVVGEDVYGARGDICMEAHHTTPIEQLQPDSVTTVAEMQIVCSNCHRVIHSEKPCFTVEEVRRMIA